MEVYHAWDAASNSRLARLAQSPAHLRAYLDGEAEKDTPARLLGRALHSAVLEPDLFPSLYVVASQCIAKKKDGDRCTYDGIVQLEAGGWVCGVHAKNSGPLDLSGARQTLSAGDYGVCLGVRDSFHASKAASGLLYAPGRAVEYSIVWQDRATGVTCKARLDVLSPGLAGGALVDLKSCQDASAPAFSRTVYNFRYYVQAALYDEGAAECGIDHAHFVFVPFEKEPPFALSTFRLTEGSIDAGAQKLRPLLERYKWCVDTGNWPAYPDAIIDLALPDFSWKQIDDELAAPPLTFAPFASEPQL